jgi:GH15 family glucan-1,4-alpha-glucosidase
MAWVAFDRTLKIAEKFGLRGDLACWREVRDEIHRYICDNCFDRQLASFMQNPGSKELDASLLLMPLVGFLPVTDSRVQGTVAAIERQLMIDGLVVRYRSEIVDDGLPAGEGVFLACSFWLVSVLKMMGRDADAKSLFDRLLSLRNDVGLLAEEYDPRAERQLGNFPQALSHIALINAAFEFTRASSPGQQRSQSMADKRR